MVFKVSICFFVFLCQVQGVERAVERKVDRKGLEGHGWDYSPSKDPMLCPDMPTSLQCIFSDNTGSRTVIKHEMFSHTCWKTVKSFMSRTLLGRGYGLAFCIFSHHEIHVADLVAAYLWPFNAFCYSFRILLLSVMLFMTQYKKSQQPLFYFDVWILQLTREYM